MKRRIFWGVLVFTAELLLFLALVLATDGLLRQPFPDLPVSGQAGAAAPLESNRVGASAGLTFTPVSTLYLPLVISQTVAPAPPGPAWQQLTPTNAGPGPRYEHGLAYNAATHQLFLFGGRDGGAIYHDVWALNLTTLTWRQLAVNVSPAPEARFSMVIIVDAPAQNLYVATGQKQGGQVLGDIWRLDLTTETWHDLSGAAGPGPIPRYGAAGGNLNGNLVVTHGFGSTRYNDTWLFNTGAGLWQQLTPGGDVPLNRCLLAATPVSKRLVLHGGCASGFGDCPLDDTWVLDPAAQSWHEISGTVEPAARQYHSLTQVAGRDQVLLFGGATDSGAANDLWLLDLTTESWQSLSVPGGPGPRFNHQAVWTPGGMLIYGGRNSGPLAELWRLTLP